MVGTISIKSPYKILVTSALPYVNNIPHMGNIVGCVLSADVFARYNRSQGNEVLFVCGTDEHGTATETKALEEGLTPKQICDKYHAIHAQVYSWFQISFNIFGRTSKENHHRITQQLFEDLHSRGYIIEKDVEQCYCETDKKFLADRFVEGECPHCHYSNARGDQCDSCGKLLDPLELINARCKTCGNSPVQKSSRHLFLDLPKLQGPLSSWVERQSVAGEWRHNAITTTNGWFQRGLEPRAITRDLSWGVPVPLKGFENKVFYVWFDAPIGYISITDQLQGVNWKEWWQDPQNVRLYQFMAKDNIPFHTILFPATMLGSSEEGTWTMLHHIDSTEYLQTEDGKFSKSRKTGLFGDDAMKTGIPSDVFRYYLLINRPESADTIFSWKDLQEKLNKELLANFGNLVNRTLSFVKQFQEGKAHEEVLDETASNFWQWVTEEEVQITDDLERCMEKDALRRIMVVSNKGNAYFQEQQPWKTRHDDPAKCRTALFVLCNLIKDLAVMIEPFMPSTSKAIFNQLGVTPKKWSDLGNMIAFTIAEPKPLFAKLEDKQLDEIKANLKGAGNGSITGADGANAESAVVSALAPLQLRAGKITEIKKHPDASKLYVETVDFGSETKTIVSGLVAHYKEEELLGKTAIFTTNLAPAKLRGIESNGMILAAQDGQTVEVVFVDATPGTLLLGNGKEAQITIDEFVKHKIEAVAGKVLVDDRPLLCDGKPVITKIVIDGKVR